jgi:hypothetical protein
MGIMRFASIMTAAQLANELRRMLDAGELDPDAVFVRPCCMCDEDVGYVEVRFVDQVRRMFSDSSTDSDETRRIFHCGNSDNQHAIQTVKLG